MSPHTPPSTSDGPAVEERTWRVSAAFAQAHEAGARDMRERAAKAIKDEVDRCERQTLVPGAVGCGTSELMSSAAVGALIEILETIAALPLTEPKP